MSSALYISNLPKHLRLAIRCWLDLAKLFPSINLSIAIGDKIVLSYFGTKVDQQYVMQVNENRCYCTETDLKKWVGGWV